MTDDLLERLHDGVRFNTANHEYDTDAADADMEESAKRIEALTAERDRLLSTVNALESLRPHWAQGYSSDSIAAQASTEALVGIWKILGVNDQTSAVVTLKALTAERDDLAHVIDNTESVYGISSEGNMWRFWAKKAKEIATKNSALTADNARLQAIVSSMKAYLAGEPSNPPATGVKKVDLAALNTGKEPSQ